MRLHITLQPSKPDMLVPMSYAYYLSAAIYRFIETSSPEYSTFLHERGYSVEGAKKHFKHFCFSQLQIPGRIPQGDSLRIVSKTIDWYVSMPVEESLRHLVVGIFEKQELFIGREENRFTVEQVETLPEPQWNRAMTFRMLSPLTLSIPEVRNGKIVPQYLLPNDSRLSSSLQINIVNKYRSLYGKEPSGDNFQCVLDQKFIADRGGYNRITKLITIKEGRTDETRVRGFMCPVAINGNPELIKLAYESGLGEKGSLGFGMITVQKHKNF